MAYIILAAIVALPQALAIDASFGGSTGSTGTSYSSIPGVSISETNSVSSQSASTSGGVTTDYGAGAVSKYFERTSNDGTATAAVYAYLSDSGKYSYSMTGTAGASSASANLKFTAGTNDDTGVRVGNFLLGGFAYNEEDYAGTYFTGRAADSLTYSNSVSASSSKVSATETFYGKKIEDAMALTWAERGQLDSEALDEDDVYNEDAGTGMWADVLSTYSTYGQGTIAYLGAPYYGMDPDNSLLYSMEYFSTQSGTITSSAPYKATATLSGDTASSSSKGTVTGGDSNLAYTSTNFASYALSGDTTTGYDAQSSLSTLYRSGTLNSVTYSGSSKATTSSATATQTASAKKADFIQSSSQSNDYTNTLTASDSLMLVSDGSTNYATFSGSETAASKAKSTSLTQKIVSSSAVTIYKSNYAENTDSAYIADASTANGLGLAISGSAVSTLAGTTKTTASASGVSIASSGQMKAVLGADSTFVRAANVARGSSVTSSLLDDPASDDLKTTYKFKENYKVTSTVAQAV